MYVDTDRVNCHRQEEDLSIEGFLNNDALHDEPKGTRSKLGLGSSRAANVYLNWSSLESGYRSGYRSYIDKSKIVDPLLDEIVRTPLGPVRIVCREESKLSGIRSAKTG